MVLFCFVLTMSLVGCGEAGEPDPNAGVYNATAVEMMGMSFTAEDIFEEGFSIELLSGGKAKLAMDGDSDTANWTLDGDRIEISDGETTLAGTLANGVMIIDDFAGESMTITLKCDSIIENSDGTADAGQENSVYGYYDAVYSADWTEEGFSYDDVYYLDEGDSLILNEDGSIDLVVEDEEYHYDTTLEGNEITLDGTSIGAVTEEGLIYLDLSDEVRYIYAREGQPAWEDWREYLGY